MIDLNRRAMLALAGGAGLTSLFPAPLFAKAPAVGLVEEMRAKHGAPALGGMIVTRADVPFLETAGTRRIDTRDRVGRDDQWCIGSNTKAMTAVVYARLVEQGAARWGAKLTELFPDFAAGMREEWKVLTIEHLLSHSAGIIDDNYDPHQWVRDNLGKKKLEELPPARTALAERVFTAKPGGPSGKFAYSNVGYVLVGAAIERLTKEPWEATIVRQLFNPLGMVSAGFGAPIGSNPWGHLPSEEKLEAINPADPRSDNPAALGPAGTVHVTLPDYARFLQLFLTNGGKLLQAETVTKLTTALVREPQAYAMGWGMIDSYPPIGGGRILFHEGSNVAWRAVTVMSLDLSIAAVGVSNDDSPKGQGAAREIAQRLLIAGKELAS